MLSHPSMSRVALAGAILWAGGPASEAWAQEDAPAAPGAEVSAPAAPQAAPASVEELEARLQAMNAQLESLSAELERSNRESRLLMEQTLKLLQENQSMGQAQRAVEIAAAQARAEAASSAASASSSAGEGEATSAEGVESNFGALRFRTEQTPNQGMRVQVSIPTAPAAPSVSQRSPFDKARARDEMLEKSRIERRVYQTVRRRADSAGSRTTFSGNDIVEKGETVNEFVLFSGNGEVLGDVKGDAVLLSGNLVVREGAHIGGDAVVLAGNLSVKDGARIDGNTVVTAGKLDVEDGARIGGDKVQMGLNPWGLRRLQEHMADHISVDLDVDDAPDPVQPTVADEVEDDDEGGVLHTVTQVLTRFLLLSAAGLLLMTFLPSRTQAVGRTLHRRMGAAALIGALAGFSLLPLGLLMTVSVVGIPLVPVLVAMAIFAVVMGLAAVALEIGRRLPGERRAPAWMLAAGAGILAVLSEVPVLGVLAMIGLTFAGLGAVLLSRFGESDATA